MRDRLITSAAVAPMFLMAILADPAGASDLGGQNNSAGGQVAGGQVAVQAGSTIWTPPAGYTPPSSGSPVGQSSGGNGGQPSDCTYEVGGASVTAELGPGGAQPGEWVFPECPNPAYPDALQPFWVVDAQAAAAAVAPVNSALLAEQAESQLGLGSPTLEMAPPPGSPQLVGVPTWLWLAGPWQYRTASASAGPVTATATATPSKVVWDLGNGDSVTCDGPGTPYNPDQPNATTDCSYTWNEAGTYTVSATVYWSVTWTATGAPGGGNLGLVAGAPAATDVTATESQAINTADGEETS